jgi:hypothetical protein
MKLLKSIAVTLSLLVGVFFVEPTRAQEGNHE